MCIIKCKQRTPNNLLNCNFIMLSPGANRCVFVWGFILYQQYRCFSYLTATVHKSVFPGLFLNSTSPAHYPDTEVPVVVLFP